MYFDQTKLFSFITDRKEYVMDPKGIQVLFYWVKDLNDCGSPPGFGLGLGVKYIIF